MRINRHLLTAAAVFAVLAIAGCATGGGGGGNLDVPPPPPIGTERIMLENGAYAVFRFDLPEGAKWSDYSKLTAEFMVDEENMKKQQRNGENARLMGNYKVEKFEASGSIINFNMGDGPNSSNAPYIMDNTGRKLTAIAVPDEWFTIEYNITGSAAHAQFVKANLPSADDTGPFLFGIGIPGQGEGRRQGIVQLVRNVTLHHASNPELNVVSKGSGFDAPAFVSYFPVMSNREGPAEE